MAETNAGGAGENRAAAPNGGAPAPVASPVIANLAGARGPIQARFDIEPVLLGPLPTKSNIGC